MRNKEFSWKDDNELFKLMREYLFSAVIGDAMDNAHYYHQFLPPQIQPLKEDMVAVGRAMPVLESDVSDEISGKKDGSLIDQPFGLMLEALDDLKTNEIYICTGSSLNYALWGELMSARAMKLGAAGAVLNGYSRDTKGILALNFPTFSHGRYAQDQGPRGKVIDFRIPIKMDRVTVNPGDIVFGDLDGICVIPQEIERDIILAALEKALGEKKVRDAIENGMSSREAFDKFGIM